ncbi:MAG: TniB family NTP-binding protein [Vulcanimicrobiaceae bacterium]|jgi:hypothetical protein
MVIAAPDKRARIAELGKRKWIKTDISERALEQLEDLMHEDHDQRPRCMLLVAESNMGKTAIAMRHAKRYPPKSDPNAESDIVPIIYNLIPPSPDEWAFNDKLLTMLHAPRPPRQRTSEAREQFIRVAKKARVRMIILDEIQYILAGTERNQSHFRNLIKYYSNELRIPIVALGVDTSIRALHADEGLKNRFELMRLPTWSYDADFLNLLVSLETWISLHRPSNLTEESMANRILKKTEGRTGRICRLLKLAAISAIRDDSERITLQTLDNCGYDP